MPITTRTQTITPRTINRLVNALLSVKNNGGVISGPEPFLQSEPGWSLSPDTEESMQLGLRYLKTSRDALRVMLDTVEAGINARQESCATVALQRGIHSIPDEVLAHIFEVGHEICDDQETGDSDDFSVAVSQVNQRFRRTALMTPRIWRNLGNWMSTSQLQTYIDRSKAAELILTVIIQQHISLEVFFAITLPHHTRWSAFTYDASEEKHNSILPTIPSQISHLTLPRLRRLGCVKPWDTTCDSDGVLPEDTFATWKMPKLVHFHTTNASIKGKGFGKNLKSVECLISDQEYRSVLDEFGTWPNLTSLNLEFRCFHSDSNREIVHLPSLRSLVIKAGEYVAGMALWMALSLWEMPVLSNISLEIGRKVSTPGMAIDALFSATKQSLGLREFTLDATHADHPFGVKGTTYAVLAKFVCNLPSLERVIFRGAGLYSAEKGGWEEQKLPSWQLFHFEGAAASDMADIRAFVTAASEDPKFKLRIGRCSHCGHCGQCNEVPALKEIMGDRMEYEAR